MAARHILIVDDEPNVAASLSKMLEHSNRDYQVSIAHSGEEALKALDRSPADLLVTDLRLPGIELGSHEEKCDQAADRKQVDPEPR